MSQTRPVSSDTRSESRPAIERTPVHHRAIDVQGYLRADGLWDIVAELRDTKAYPIELPDRGLIPLGEQLHQLVCTLTVTSGLEIVDLIVEMNKTPFSDCRGAEARYAELIGLTLKTGWLDEVKQRLTRNQSCTHITELLPTLATAAIQTIHGYSLNGDTDHSTLRKSEAFLRDGCQGYRSGGPTQKLIWPDSK